eukprot:TRINITY_DN5953_c0_g1_i1.p1 TRINITY_DN5953_c0_g1~~TRINITY_DN5953_c0_g1_i1.p1  ORF type:complete len:703 (+),score=391.78 TRINITY_DN5953_c0_g1_i1:65-2173(+)
MAGTQQDLLREFYFSAGNNYSAFKKKKDKTGNSPATSPSAGGGAAAAAETAAPKTPEKESVPVERPAAVKKEPAPVPAAKPVSGSAKAAAQAKRSSNAKPASAGSASASGGIAANSVDAASQEYIQFLKQQQDLQKCHNRLEEILSGYEGNRRTQQKELGQVRKSAQEMLTEMEGGSGWNLKSKYNVDNVIKDAGLALMTGHLIAPEAPAQYFEIQQCGANLGKLKQDHGEKEQYEPHKVSINNGLRRLERVEKELKNTQVDATELARVPDSLLIQLEHVFNTATLASLLSDDEDTMEHLLFKLDKAKEDREAALDDGEMQLAEKYYYTIVELYDELQTTVLNKLSIVDKTQKETSVFDKVRATYQNKASESIKNIKNEKEKLKQKCEEDTHKMFSLREKIEEVERHMVLKMAEDCKKSDAMLADNSARLDACWAKIEECERELVTLERERHREIKRRVEDKEKDEQRRMEFERFCSVCDSHAAHLDLTIRNCESLVHAANLVGEFVQSGFNGLAKDFSTKTKDYAETHLHVHKEHLTMFRGLFLALGELTHKKEKKIEDVDKQIQTSHINQELCSDTLNPNAKKFSDVKKELLLIRDGLEQDVRELKEKAEDALRKFKETEDALQAAEVPFVHPVLEQQEQALATRARMVEMKAIAIGHVDSVPIRNEIEDLKRQIASTKQQVETINHKTAVSSATLPAVK